MGYNLNMEVMNFDINRIEKSLSEQFSYIEEVRDYNQRKVLEAFKDNRVAPEHFMTVSGYGHDDIGREVLDKTFAQVLVLKKRLLEIILYQERMHYVVH